jgi:hypothetical protein
LVIRDILGADNMDFGAGNHELKVFIMSTVRTSASL